MRETVKKLGAQSLTYGLGGMLTRLLGLILLPVYTRYLTPADYGILALLGLTSGVAAIIAGCGLGSAMFREVIYCETDRRKVESTALWFLLGVSALLFGSLILVSAHVSKLIFRTPEYTHLLHLIFAGGFFGVLDIVILARLRIREQASLYAFLAIARFLVGAALNILFIVVLRRGLQGLIEAGLIMMALFALIYAWILVPNLLAGLSPIVLRKLLRFGLPLVPANLSNLSMTSADRYFLQHYATTAQVGLYSLGYSISLVTNLAVQAVQLAWPAQMFAIAKQPDGPATLGRLLTYYAAAIGFVALAISIMAHELLRIFTTPAFYDAYTVVPLISLAYAFYGMGFMASSGLAVRDKMKYTAPLLMGAALFNLALNAILIPAYGMTGAAWATFVSYFLLFVVQTVVNLHFWHIPYEYSRILRIAAAWGAAYSLSLLVQHPNLWVAVGLKGVALFSYPVLLYLLRFYRPSELLAIKEVIRRVPSRMRNRTEAS